MLIRGELGCGIIAGVDYVPLIFLLMMHVPH